jgi:hypothetical protein
VKTYSEIIDYVKKTLDLQEELFITPAEFLIYTEEALKFCESECHKLHIEDQYFVSCKPLALVSGRSEYLLPTDCFANKILRIVYDTGSDLYNIPRIRNSQRFESGALIDSSGSSDDYGYMLVNSDPRIGTRIRLYPKSRETVANVELTLCTTTASSRSVTVSSTASLQPGYFASGTTLPNGARIESIDSATTLTLTAEALTTSAALATITFTEPRALVWYIRRVTVPATGTDLIDFPEFWNFVAQHVIVQCLLKEIGNPRLQAEAMKLEKIKEQVISTLSSMVPDEDDKLEKDMEAYAEMDMSEGVY